MAMRELIDGDCGVTNPLLKIAGHFTQDKGPQAGQPSSASASDQLVKEFLFDANEAERHAPTTFNMDALLHQMTEISAFYHQRPNEGENVEDFSGENDWRQIYSDVHDLAYESNRLNALDSESFDNKWADEFLITSEQDIQNQRLLGNDWTQNFKAQSCSEINEIAIGLSDSVTDPNILESKFMKFIQQVGEGKVDLQQIEREKHLPPKSVADLEEHLPPKSVADLEEHLLPKSVADIEEHLPPKSLADIWSADFPSSWVTSAEGLEVVWKGSQHANKDFKTVPQTEDEKVEEAKNANVLFDDLQREWEFFGKNDPKEETNEHPYSSELENCNPYKAYTFMSENPFLKETDAFTEGLKKLESGDLPSAVLLFEAAVQKNPNHIEAWQYLGSSQAKNEQDPAAIAALKRCLELDPDNLTALMSLAVSYTNETMQVQACETLVKWLLKNPKYTHLVKYDFVDETLPVSSILPSEKREAAKEMFIEAARMNPTDPDPDVQNGLGVLFNLSSEYDKAIDCFKAALEVRPDDSLLWNRVGATLANSNRPGEAIEAYYRALELYPGFIRARFNLGISCINLGAAKEAAEHFLSALNLQNAGRGPQGKTSKDAMSSNIWSTLRTTMTLLKRADLYPAVDFKDLDLLNKEFGMEV